MVTTADTNAIRQAALDHLWMHNADWVTMAEEGGPPIMVKGDGVRVTDAEGNVWIDAHGGYASVNAGYGHTAIADTMLEQMRKLTYFPQGTTTAPLIRLVEKLAELAPDNLERVWPVSGGSEANETAVKIARAYHKRAGRQWALQGHQQARLVPRRDGRRDVDGRKRGHQRLRARDAGHAVCAAAVFLPLRVRQ